MVVSHARRSGEIGGLSLFGHSSVGVPDWIFGPDFFDPGVCSLDSDRNADQNADLEISGTLISVQICQIPDFGLLRLDSQGGFSRGILKGWILKGDSQRMDSQRMDSQEGILKGWILNCCWPAGQPSPDTNNHMLESLP